MKRTHVVATLGIILGLLALFHFGVSYQIAHQDGATSMSKVQSIQWETEYLDNHLIIRHACGAKIHGWDVFVRVENKTATNQYNWISSQSKTSIAEAPIEKGDAILVPNIEQGDIVKLRVGTATTHRGVLEFDSSEDNPQPRLRCGD